MYKRQPSTYAHRRFGTNVLEHLPDELRAQLEQNRELYDIGLHGPDPVSYTHLDVYKRQRMGWKLTSGTELEFTPEQYPAVVKKCALVWMRYEGSAQK